MTDFPAAGRHALRSLTRFTGRDSRPQFWFWVLWLFVGYQVLGALLGIGLFLSMGDLFANPATQPSPVTGAIGDGHLFLFRMILAVILGVVLLIVGLVAGSITRRLHDSDLRGAWGLLPLPFLLFGSGGMLFVFGTGVPSMALFMALFFNNIVYLISLVVLVILLCRRSTPGPNRFGAAPTG